MSDKNKVSAWAEMTKGIIKDNPVFVAALGLCPTLAVTTQTINGLAMGVAVIFVLVFSNIFVSLLRDFIPKTVRIPSYILIIASFVTLVSLFLQAFAPDMNKALGIFIPLIVVNCVILGRAEAFAGKNTVGKSTLDGLGMGIGFTLALTLIGLIREFIGSSTITLLFAGLGKIYNFGTPILGDPNVVNVAVAIKNPAVVMIMPPGGFLIMGILLALFQHIKNKKDAKAKAEKQRRAAEAKAKAAAAKK